MKRKRSDGGTIDIHDLLKAQREYAEKEARGQYRHEHKFDIIHVVLSSISIVISIIALIVSFIALG